MEGDVYSIQNPWALLRSVGILRLTDGTKLPFNRTNRTTVWRLAMFALENGVRFGTNSGCWRIDPEVRVLETPEGIRFLTESLDDIIFTETFLNDAHFVDFELGGRVVIEGGAFVGDTALYYARQGATVYSFEPDPRSHELAQQNLALNPELAQRVTLRNWALGRDGEVEFPILGGGSGGASLTGAAARHVRVRSVGIGTLLEEFGLRNPYLLHLDIKGQEFAVMSDDALGRFERLRIEYSPYLFRSQGAGSPSLRQLLLRLRELGFGEIRTFKHNHLRYDLSDHGTLDARKVPT